MKHRPAAEILALGFCPEFRGKINTGLESFAMRKSVNDLQYQALLSALKSAREAQNLTVRDVGTLIGETNQIVSKIETGVRKLSVHEFVQYCVALKLDPLETLKILL